MASRRWPTKLVMSWEAVGDVQLCTCRNQVELLNTLSCLLHCCRNLESILRFTCIRTFLRFSPKPYRRQHYIFFWPIFAETCRRRIMGYFVKQSPKHYFGFQHAGQNSMESGYDYVWQYRMPYNVFEQYLTWLFYSSNNLGWFACFRIQFLPDHIMIHSCLVWFPWWLRHGAMEPFEATLFRVSDDCPDCRINTF